MYKYRYTRKTIIGYKDWYHCHVNQKCPRTLYILRHSDSLKASIWLAKTHHQHKSEKAQVLPMKSEAHIKKLQQAPTTSKKTQEKSNGKTGRKSSKDGTKSKEAKEKPQRKKTSSFAPRK